MPSFSELVVEQAALEWFDALGYNILNATEIAPDQPNSERQTYADVVLRDRLQNALETINPDLPAFAIEDAIARVNRVFKDKLGGLVVDYLDIANQLKEALKNYTEGDRHQIGIPTEVALDAMQEKYEIVRDIYHGFDYQKFFTGIPGERVSLIPEAMDFILGLENGRGNATSKPPPNSTALLPSLAASTKRSRFGMKWAFSKRLK